jgi:hypothetical protein
MSVCVCVCVCPILHPHLYPCLPYLYSPLLPLFSISSSLPSYPYSYLSTSLLPFTYALTHSLTPLPSILFLTPLSPILSHSLLQTYVTLVELLERARQYRAVLALYRVMVRDGYDFYENTVLNGVFKRLGRCLFLSLYVLFHCYLPSVSFFFLSSFQSLFIYSCFPALPYDGHFILSFPLLSLS